MKLLNEGFKYIDLFAGIGGFHQAMKKMGGVCVFAAELNEETAKTYTLNYQIESHFDITKINPSDIPAHDVLCAGFPCQSFSKAGNQKGFNDVRGVLFFDIVRILHYHLLINGGPKFLLLENVRNIVSHDSGKTWLRIKEELIKLNYNVIETPLIVSPHYFGIPQLRERAVILAVRNDIYNQEIKLYIDKQSRNSTNIDQFLVTKSTDEYKLQSFKISDYENKVLEMWDDFFNGIKEEVIGFPIWSEYFLNSEINPNYPEWKKEFIRKNISLYNNNKSFIDKWIMKYDQLSWVLKTHKKFEWQAGNTIKSVFDGIIQFRTSGVRVKQPSVFPALVAMVHIPIIGRKKRYLTPRECANLQSFPEDFKINSNIRLAYKQFGNAVNVDVIYNVFNKFLDSIGGDLDA
ncbi:MAG: DNA cytosine methyltransferase [Firmicutes bacterium]|nr:DNA cytosine methyltransferase [Bacillota bacterium]